MAGTAAGRAILSVFVVAIVFVVVSWSVPDSELKKQAVTRLRPFVQAVGLDQSWGVFAPDPPRDLVELQVRIAYQDGTRRTWLLPRGDRALGAYWDYHWRKYTEILSAPNSKDQWEPTARWVVRHERAHGRRPVSITLSRKVTRLNPPGARPFEEHPQTTDFYTYSVSPAAP